MNDADASVRVFHDTGRATEEREAMERRWIAQSAPAVVHEARQRVTQAATAGLRDDEGARRLVSWHKLLADTVATDVAAAPARRPRASRAAAVAAPVATLERPRPLPRAVGDGAPAAYLELAASIGFEPADLLGTEILAFLHEQQIPVYDRDAVRGYMTALADRTRGTFIWRPLRKADAVDWTWSTARHDGYRPGTPPNRKLVPAHILGDVKMVLDRFCARVAFFVSDIGPDPDPFVCVAAEGVEPIVFGCWDEPGFGVI